MSHIRLPPTIENLYLPTDGRRSFASGFPLWSATRRRARLIRRACWTIGTTLGPGFLPGHRQAWVSPLASDVAEYHEDLWRTWFGPYDRVAAYMPAQAERSGFAAILIDGGVARGFIKCRRAWDASQEVAVAQQVSVATTFWAPELVGHGAGGGWTSLGTAPMPAAMHSPVIDGSVAEVAQEATALLDHVLGTSPGGLVSMHGDMGPWNLRQLPGARPVLFDWEHVDHGPPWGDLVFHTIASQALGFRPTVDIADHTTALEFWRREIPARFASDRRDAKLADEMLKLIESHL